VAVNDPYGEKLHCDIHDNRDGTYTCTYNPVDPGEHLVAITLGNAPIAKSPYKVNIEESMRFASPHKSWADGPGLEDGNKATDPGAYHVSVVCRNPSNPIFFDHVKGSPKVVNIEAGTDASQSLAFGPGLEPGLLDTFPAKFRIQAKDKHGKNMPEGGDPFVVEINGPTGPIHCDVVDNGDGTYDCTYNPEDAGRHDVSVTLDGQPIKGSTYHVDIKPGAWPGNTFIENFFFTIRTVDKRGANKTFGGEKIAVAIHGPRGVVPGDIQDRGDGTYHVTYKAIDSGDYQVHVTLNDQHIRGSPFLQKIQ